MFKCKTCGFEDNIMFSNEYGETTCEFCLIEEYDFDEGPITLTEWKGPSIDINAYLIE